MKDKIDNKPNTKTMIKTKSKNKEQPNKNTKKSTLYMLENCFHFLSLEFAFFYLINKKEDLIISPILFQLILLIEFIILIITIISSKLKSFPNLKINLNLLLNFVQLGISSLTFLLIIGFRGLKDKENFHKLFELFYFVLSSSKFVKRPDDVSFEGIKWVLFDFFILFFASEDYFLSLFLILSDLLGVLRFKKMIGMKTREDYEKRALELFKQKREIILNKNGKIFFPLIFFLKLTKYLNIFNSFFLLS